MAGRWSHPSQRPALQVPADLGAQGGYMSAINKATADIDVQLVFCNAGYILSGFFYSRPVEAVLANIECNAVSAVAITHHFLKRMVRVTCAPAYPDLCAAARPLPHPTPTHRDTHTCINSHSSFVLPLVCPHQRSTAAACYAAARTIFSRACADSLATDGCRAERLLCLHKQCKCSAAEPLCCYICIHKGLSQHVCNQPCT
jgi:NAD(P)-dependent dehydrogenase (short-subunit alcohol dehydrogenase family)